LSDRNGEIEGKMWDYVSDIHENVGAVVKIRGVVQEYNGNRQLIIERIRKAQEGDPYDLKDLVPSAPINIPVVLGEIERLLKALNDDTYRSIALGAFERMKEDLKTIPAAISVHHAFLGGLLMHTYNIMQMCLAAGQVYGYDIINMDLLLTGAFCHDMGKRKEFLRSELGLVTEYSVPGQLMGHLVMGAQEIAEIAQELNIPVNSEPVILLQHMLLSHHGELEFGSPVVPKIIEAEILSRMDMLDARVESYREVMEDTEIGNVSDYIKNLGHSIFNHS
jgi:3'-5' exoribonuclease